MMSSLDIRGLQFMSASFIACYAFTLHVICICMLTDRLILPHEAKCRGQARTPWQVFISINTAASYQIY